MNQFHIVIFGEGVEKVPDEVLKLGSSFEYVHYDADKILDPMEKTPSVIVCYPPRADGEMKSSEIAQTLSSLYAGVPLFFVATERKEFEKKKLIKNGFSQVFLLPWEKKELILAMSEQVSYHSNPELRNLHPVKIVDLKPEQILEFPLKAYLPQNNRIVQFSQPGEPISPEKLDKLAANHFSTLFIKKEDLPVFYEYTKKVLKTAMSETERQEKLDTCVRELVSDLFVDDTRENTFGKSQALLEEIKSVILLLIQESEPKIVSKVESIMDHDDDIYSHMKAVASYAGIFAMILKHPNPEQVALAGLLHDIGKINMPEEFAGISAEDLGPHALESYKQHPKYSIDILRMKKIIVSDETQKAILQHHERLNGSGYPMQLTGDRICLGARILAIADSFEHYTRVKPGKPRYSSSEALIKMFDDNIKDPGDIKLDPEILRKLKEFFLR